MASAVGTVPAFEFMERDTLKLGLDEGLNRTIDFESVLEAELSGPLSIPLFVC
ncbi:MAG: hypothetical protein RIS92_1759 [Verrucomicrobiota bacterium]